VIRPREFSALATYEQKLASPDHHLPGHIDDAMTTWAPAADMGCLDGVPARFPTPAAAFGWLDTMRSRERTGDDQCPGNWISFEQVLEATRIQRSDPVLSGTWAYTLLQFAAGLVYHRCVTD
jgi:hypothetical protein